MSFKELHDAEAPFFSLKMAFLIFSNEYMR